MALTQLIYASRPFGFDAGMLNQILFQARENNARHDITGALICRSDLYLQLLEGPSAAVEETYARIARDDRHVEVTCLMTRETRTRLFAGWAMRDDAARSWMWTMQEVADGAVARCDTQEALGVFTCIAAGLPEDPPGTCRHA